METFRPRLDILPDSQRRLWKELVHLPKDLILYGDAAIALHLGHRESIDFDFFSTAPFTPDYLYASLPFLAGAEILQSKPNTRRSAHPYPFLRIIDVSIKQPTTL